MSIEQINHLERLVRSRDIELKEVKQKLYNAGAIIAKKNEEIEELKEMIKFHGEQLEECRENYKAQKAISEATKKGTKWGEEIKYVK